SHIRSYFYIQEIGYKYSKMNDTQDLDKWRKESYENDFMVWFQEVNEICEEYENIRYVYFHSVCLKENEIDNISEYCMLLVSETIVYYEQIEKIDDEFCYFINGNKREKEVSPKGYLYCKINHNELIGKVEEIGFLYPFKKKFLEDLSKRICDQCLEFK
ncbi:10130_t:CDS:2, partial [Dentiscutata heterogama]